MEKQKINDRINLLKKNLGNYTLNPDETFVNDLVEGLLVNKERYGIESCPCRLFEGTDPKNNYDIICPCIYREQDLKDYGSCYCALYINEKYSPSKQVPERRLPIEKRNPSVEKQGETLYRCEICGYEWNGEKDECPLCHAGKEYIKAL